MGQNTNDGTFYESLSKTTLIIVVLIGVIELIVFFSHFAWPFNKAILGSHEQFGAFGDFIGGTLNPLLQFVVISMLFWSIQVQRKELENSNKILVATQYELTQTKIANEKQASALSAQIKFYISKEKFDQQIALINNIEESIEKLLTQPLLLEDSENGINSHKVALSEIFYSPTSKDAGLFRRATHSDTANQDCVRTIVKFITARMISYGFALSEGISENILTYQMILIKMSWFGNMAMSFRKIEVFSDAFLKPVYLGFQQDIKESNLNIKQRGKISELLEHLNIDGKYQK